MPVMQFPEFAQRVDAAVRDAAPVERADGDATSTATWITRGRRAAMTLAPPLNVSVELTGPDGGNDTTWYPIDAALVPTVSKRIAGYLSEA